MVHYMSYPPTTASVKLSNGCNLKNPMNLNELNAGQMRLVFIVFNGRSC